MIFKKIVLIISTAATIVATQAKIGNFPNVDTGRVFDQDLYKSVLDPELCARQLEYIQSQDSSLRLQFLDSGLKLPRGILLGNTYDFGNYQQCLSINTRVDDMTIQGKHCMIDIVPLDFLSLSMDDHLKSGYNEIEPNEKQLRLLEENKKKELLLAKEGRIHRDSVSRTVPGWYFSFMLSICIPHACTPKETLDSSILNITGNIGERIQERYCRLPNDKPFVAADYVAWVVFSVLGLVTIVSTLYDVRHTLILKKDPKEANELFSAFSVYKNSCKLIDLKKRPGTVECLDGIRALSIMWVVLGHTFFMGVFYPANAVSVLEGLSYEQDSNFIWQATNCFLASMERTRLGMGIEIREVGPQFFPLEVGLNFLLKNNNWMKNAYVAVDTFFLLSGLLVVYTTASKFTPIKFLKNLHLFYLHRILRLTPVLAVVILFITSIQHHVGDGPVWHLAGREVEACRSYWWMPLLHIQNFLKPQGGCLGESWYLAIDMQLHIISPIVLFWIFTGSKKSSCVALVSSFTISLTAATIYIFLKEDILTDNNYAHFYVNILTRAPPFFVGLIFGYLLHLYRDQKCTLSKTMGYSITTFSLGILALVQYTMHISEHGEDINETIIKIIMSFEKTIWAISVGWVIFACANGYAGPINWFLSMTVWKIPSRISYSMYLCHMTVIMYAYHAATLTPVYFTIPLFMFDYMGFLYLTLFVGFFITALIDLPFATLFRILLMGGNKSQPKPVLPNVNEIKVVENDTLEKL